MNSRFYCTTITPGRCEIRGDQAEHIGKVLRHSPGDAIEIFDGCGTVATAVIGHIGKNSVVLDICEVKKFNHPAAGRIIICVSIARGQRFDWLVGKCTELGVERIVPVILERTVKSGGSDISVERYNRIAIESSKQCGRVFLPQIERPVKFEHALKIMSQDYPQGIFLFGSPDKNAKPVHQIFDPQKDYVCFIGPEGGFSDNEIGLLTGNNAVAVKLTQTILRVETAAETIAAVLCCMKNKVV